MNKTTLQFQSLAELAAFLESAELMNFEINHNHLTLRCETEQAIIDRAIYVFHASVLELEVLG